MVKAIRCVLALSVLIMSCGSTQISARYRADAPFASYRTFAIDRIQVVATEGMLLERDSIEHTLRSAVAQRLRAEGLRTAARPDLTVRMLAAVRPAADATLSPEPGVFSYEQNNQIRYGLWEKRFDDELLVVELSETKSGRMIWRTELEGGLRGMSGQTLERALERAFASFPPKPRNTNLKG